MAGASGSRRVGVGGRGHADGGRERVVLGPGCPGPELGFYSVCGRGPLVASYGTCCDLVYV